MARKFFAQLRATRIEPRGRFRMKTAPTLLLLSLCALFASLGAVSARAATFNISNGDVAALISAIDTANSNSQDDTVDLASNGTYTLIASYSGSDGLPVIGSDGGKKLTIHGNGAMIRPDGNATQPFRIMRCAKGANVSISGLTITGGHVVNPDFGAGIYNDGTLALTQCSIVGNYSGPFGAGSCGGVYNAGSLTAAESTVSGNSAYSNSAYSGGGICNDGSLTISNSEVNGNSGGFGTGIVSSGTLTITNSTIDHNETGDTGGEAIINFGSATITNSSISGNNADCATGGIENGGSMQLTNCIINNNYGVTCSGLGGGAISNGGPLRITNCTISGNGTGGPGGAIYNGGSLTVTNCTLSQNQAGDSFGNSEYGGGIYNAGSLNVMNSTLSDNAATSGGAAVYNSGNSAVTKLANTILKKGGPVFNLGNDNGGAISSLGYNLSNDSGGGFLTATGDRINTNPMLGPLQDNGGPTFTQELLVGSPAIDAGNPAFNPNSFSPPLLYDQRGPGFARVANGRVDMGAFELQPHFETEKLAVQALQGATHSIINDAKLSGGAGTQLNATGTGQYVTYTVPVNVAGTYKLRVRVKTGPNRGTFKLSIGGVAQGTAQDEYTSTVGYTVRDLGTVTFFSVGSKAFKFLVSGKNTNSSGYGVAFDYIQLISTNRLETESLKVQSITPVPSGYTPAQWYGVFNVTAASGGAGTYFNANAIGNYITYTVPVASAGTYRVRVGIQTKPNKGIF